MSAGKVVWVGWFSLGGVPILPNFAKSIMLSNERFALECLQRYAESGDIVDATNGQFAHCPQPERYGDKGYYLTWEDHQHQGLLQSRDIGECCFFKGHAKKWLLDCDHFPDNYFELWDIYEKYASKQSKKIAEKLHEEKDELGRSVHALRAFEKVHLERDSLGRSAHAVKASEKVGRDKSKVMGVTFPNGRVGVYPSVNMASMFTGIPKTTLRNWAHKGLVGKYGKNKGYGARYL